MDKVFLQLFNMSITASWLVLAVVILRLLLKKAPKAITCLLWVLVAVRLVFPFSIESMLSLIPSAETVPPDIVYAKEPMIDSGVTAINSVVNPIMVESFAPKNELTSINPIQVFLAFAELIWIMGMIAMVLYTAISFLRLRMQVREAVPMRDKIYVCDKVATPFILGVLRPRIYLPSAMEANDMEYVIAHERAHLKRFDHLWKPLGFLLLTVYWFNPVLWVAYILLCRDIELACDERVIRDMNAEDKKAYSTALLNCSIPRRMISACPLAFGEVGVKQRIKSVLHYKKPAFWIIVAALVVSVAVTVGFLTDPKEYVFSDIARNDYMVEEVLYQAPHYSFMMIAGENTPCFACTADGKLLRCEDAYADNWTNLGTLEEFSLTKENFDDHFIFFDDAAAIRRKNATAWQLTHSGNVYYALMQKDGTFHIAFGYGKTIGWLFKMKEEPFINRSTLVVSGENTGRTEVFYTDESIEYIKEQIDLHNKWIDITFDQSTATPFEVYNTFGQQQLGLFSIYDANTLQPLDFFRPSGLAPHTYIFQNAVSKGEYIITMQYDESNTMLCFGARLPMFTALQEYESAQTYIKGAKGIETFSDEWYAETELYSTALNYGASDTEDSYSAPIRRFDTLEELEAFKETFGNIYIFDKTYQELPSFNAATVPYDESFFKNNSLFVIYIRSTSGSCRYAVESIVDDGENFVVNVGLTQGPRTDDWQEWFLTLAIAKEDFEGCTAFDAQVYAKEVAAKHVQLDTYLYGSGVVQAQLANILSDPIYADALNSERFRDGFTTKNYPIHKIETYAELEAFRERHADLLATGRGSEGMYFANITYHCDEAFFKDKALLVAYIEAPSMGDRFAVGGISIDHTGFSMLIEQTEEGKDTAMEGWLAYVFIDKARIADCPAFHAYLTNAPAAWDALFGTWEAPMTVMGLPAEETPEDPMLRLTFKEDHTGVENAAGDEREFVWMTEDDLLEITYVTEDMRDEFVQYTYRISGSLLTLTDVLYPNRSMDLRKVAEQLTATELRMYFFGAQNLPSVPKVVSGFTFDFEQNSDYSLLCGENKEYLDNAMLSGLETNEPVFSFSLYQDTLPYTEPLLEILNSVVTVDYEGNTYDAADAIEKHVFVSLNGVKATVSEVRLGKGNGHVDFSFKFSTGKQLRPGDITSFHFAVKPTSGDLTAIAFSPILTQGDVKIIPTAMDGDGDFGTFILQVGDREIAFEGDCCAEDHWERKLFVEDLTGDGVEDITVAFQNEHGTGFYGEDIHVFDGVTLEEYEVEKVYETIGDYIQFSADADFAYIHIGDVTHKIDKMMFYPNYEKENWWEQPHLNEIFFYSVKDGVLQTELRCKYTPFGICGSIFADYTFEDGKFVYNAARFAEE